MDKKGGKIVTKIKKTVTEVEASKIKKVRPVAKIKQSQPLLNNDFKAQAKRLAPESLAMLHHLHGTNRKVKPVKGRFFRLRRLSDALEADWSLWHLAFSIVWRIVFIIALVRFVAAYTVIYILPLL